MSLIRDAATNMDFTVVQFYNINQMIIVLVESCMPIEFCRSPRSFYISSNNWMETIATASVRFDTLLKFPTSDKGSVSHLVRLVYGRELAGSRLK